MLLKSVMLPSRPVIMILMLVMFLSACSKSSNSTPGANEVFIESFSFTPSTITVAVNTTITWTNKDGIAHTVTSDEALFDSGTVNPKGTYTHQFTSLGTFSYHCTIHPTMTGKVVVQ